jgi:hypothetical protein
MRWSKEIEGKQLIVVDLPDRIIASQAFQPGGVVMATKAGMAIISVR